MLSSDLPKLLCLLYFFAYYIYHIKEALCWIWMWYFEYDIKTGKIIPIFKEGNRREKAKHTIDLLNLNDNRLCEIRKKYIFEFLSYSKNNKYSLNNFPVKFPSLRRYLEGRL